MARSLPALLPFVLVLPALAAPSLSGSYELSGRDAHGRYRGTATLVQDAQDRVTGVLGIEYVRWSWSTFSLVPTGQYGAARIEGRAVGSELRGVRRIDGGMAGAIGLGGSLATQITYRIAVDGARIDAVHGSYAQGAERLHRHRPALDQRHRDLLALRYELESATSGLLWMSESDRPLRWAQFNGAAATVQSVADFRARLRVEPDRAAEERTLAAAFGRRVEHQPGETAEEAALVDRWVRVKTTLESRLSDVRVYRVGPPGSTGKVMGEVRVFFLGRNSHGDLVGLVTIAIET